MQIKVQSNNYAKPNYQNNNYKKYSTNIFPLKNLSFKGNEDSFDYVAQLDEKLSKMGWIRKYILRGKKRAEAQTTIEQIDFRTKKCDKLEIELNQREEAVNQRDHQSKTRVDACDKDITKRKREMNEAEVASQTKIKKTETESSLKIQEAESLSRKKIQTAESQSNAKIEQAEETSHNNIAKNERILAQKEQNLVSRENQLAERRGNIEKRETSVQIKEGDQVKKGSELTLRENDIKIKEDELISESDFMKEVRDKLKQMDADLNGRQQEILIKEETIKQKEEMIAKKKVEVAQIKKEAIKMKEDALQTKERAVQSEKNAIKIKEEIIQLEEDSVLGRLHLFSSKENRLLEEKKKTLQEKEAYLSGLEESLIKEKQELSTERATLEQIREIYKKISEPPSPKGFDRIAGYNKIKNQLSSDIIERIALEKAGKNTQLPNGVFLYGPKGNGKKTIIKALAEQTNCNYVEVDMMQSDREILSDLLKIAQQSQKDYETNGAKKRTMVLLEEFDSISSENIPFIAKMKNLLSNCAEKYKCTVFMTSINPVNFEQELFAEQRVPLKMFINPPEKEDAAEIFKFHLKNSGEASIDYNKLADEVINARKSGQAYSSYRISRVVDNCRDLAADYLQKITESDLIYELKKLGPDISKETMEKFGKDITKMGKNIL